MIEAAWRGLPTASILCPDDRNFPEVFAFHLFRPGDLADAVGEVAAELWGGPAPEGRRATPGRADQAPPCSLTTRRAEANNMPMLTDLGHTTTATTSSWWLSRTNRWVRLLLLTRISWK